MTIKRRNWIALLVMGDILSDKFGNKPLETIDRQAETDAIILNRTTYQPQTEQLRIMMRKLYQFPTWSEIEKLVLTYGDLAYRWMIYHVMIANDEHSLHMLRRKVGNKASALRISPTQLIEFYRQLYIDAINEVLAPTQDEAPLRPI